MNYEDRGPFLASQKLLILRGIPACGKSTFARDLQKSDPSYKRVNRDDLRAMIDNSVWSKSNESLIRNIRNQIISTYLHAGFNVIVDDTNLQSTVVTELRALGTSCNPKLTVEVKTFDVPLGVCLERNSKREGVAKVPEDVIRRFHKDLQNGRSVEQARLQLRADLKGKA